MPKMIFVNLPVADLPRSIRFYEAIGATLNPEFTDETAACMVLSDVIHVMLLTHDKFRQFSSKAIPDAHASAQVLLALSCESRAAVDAMVEAARRNGGKPDVSPVDEHGWMYGRSFDDPDGHCWGPMWMDLEQFRAVTTSAAAA